MRGEPKEDVTTRSGVRNFWSLTLPVTITRHYLVKVQLHVSFQDLHIIFEVKVFKVKRSFSIVMLKMWFLKLVSHVASSLRGMRGAQKGDRGDRTEGKRGEREERKNVVIRNIEDGWMRSQISKESVGRRGA